MSRSQYVNYIKELLKEGMDEYDDELDRLPEADTQDDELISPEDDIDVTDETGEENPEEQPTDDEKQPLDSDRIIFTLRELVLKQLLDDELTKLGLDFSELPQKLQASINETNSEIDAIESEEYPERLKKVNSAVVELFKKVAGEINVTNAGMFDSLEMLKGGLKITGDEIEAMDELVERVKKI